MIATSAASRRALTAEYAFSLFAAHATVAGPTSLEELEASAWHETTRRLRPYTTAGLDIDAPLSGEEQEDTREIRKRLTGCFLTGDAKPLIIRPLFPGCGFIDASEGDIIAGKTIFEIKTVDRTFRTIDIRQLVAYAALNFAAPRYEVERLGLFNPRRGVLWESDLETVCVEIAGLTAVELLSAIVSSVSSGDISR
jgi:hypothetical protein